MKTLQSYVAGGIIAVAPILILLWSSLRLNKTKVALTTCGGGLVFWFLGGFLTFLIILIGFAGAFYNFSDRLLYYPDLPPQSRQQVDSPAAFGLPYEDIKIFAEDGTELHLYVIKQQENSNLVPTILYFHGNAGNVGHRLQHAAELYQAINCNIVMLEYRGYGKSGGAPSEEGLYMDARAGIDFITRQPYFNHKEIVVFGRSLGGAVAINLATQPGYDSKIWCLIVENTFTSIPDMANVQIGWRILKKLPLFTYKNKYVSSSIINKLKVPSLFISGLSDTLVPSWMMVKLHALCGSPYKQLKQFESGSHNDTWNCPGYYDAIQKFLTEARLHKEKHVEPAEPSAMQSVLVV